MHLKEKKPNTKNENDGDTKTVKVRKNRILARQIELIERRKKESKQHETALHVLVKERKSARLRQRGGGRSPHSQSTLSAG